MNSAETQQETEKQQWPAVDTAYGFVMPSYQFIVTRFEAADSRLNNLVTFISTMIVGLPVLARAMWPEVNFASPLFVVTVLTLVVAAIVGISGRLQGSLTLANPSVLFRESLHESDWEFKKNAIFYAGKHFQANAEAIDRKANAALITSLLMLGALVVAAIWLTR